MFCDTKPCSSLGIHGFACISKYVLGYGKLCDVSAQYNDQSWAKDFLFFMLGATQFNINVSIDLYVFFLL